MNSYLNFEQGEISIYLAGDGLANLHHSLQQAEAIRRDKRRGAVLYINTSFTTRKFMSAWREHISATDGIYALDCRIGELLSYFDVIKDTIKKHNICQIIINNWEYGFKDHRQKNEAIFSLNTFLNMNVSLLIYGQANPEKAKPGKIMHGSLGKLTGLAIEVYDLVKEAAKEEKLEETLRENVNLVASKINDLAYPHEDLDLAVGGEMGMEQMPIARRGITKEHLVAA